MFQKAQSLFTCRSLRAVQLESRATNYGELNTPQHEIIQMITRYLQGQGAEKTRTIRVYMLELKTIPRDPAHNNRHFLSLHGVFFRWSTFSKELYTAKQ